MAMEYQYEIDTICFLLKDIVKTCLRETITDVDSTSIPLKKKSKDLRSGEIVLPRFIRVESEQTSKLLQSVQETLGGKCNIVKDVIQDKHNILSFYLDRPAFSHNVFKEVFNKGLDYGHCCSGNGRSIILLPFMVECERRQAMESSMDMRMFYVLIHLKKILQACGYEVQCAKRLENNGAEHDDNVKKRDFISSAQKLLLEQKENGENDGAVVDLRSIISREKFLVGKDGFDKNLEKAEVFTPEGKITSTIQETITFDDTIESQNFDNIVHVVPQNKVFRLQQTLVLHYALSGKQIKQSQLVVGPVMCKGNITMEEFHRSRFEQMKETSEMRHGVKCEGSEWEAKIDQLSQAGIKMEVLGTALHCPLKMDLHSSHNTENRLGAFVLYNSARLSTLLRQFLQGVKKGTYPPLPPLEDVKLSLLREQEEWELIFVYIASFPNTVSESVEVVFPQHGKLTTKIHTHRITNFLISFSKCLSSYYSRYHILGGPEAHLLPLMYARLHLIQACHQVMTNALQLLDIQPLQQL